MKILLTLFFALLYVSCNNEVKNEHSYLECVIYWVSDHQPKTHPWGPNNEPEERRIAIGATIYNHTKNRMFVPVQDFRDSIYCSRIVVKYKGKDITYKSEIRFPSKQRSYNDIHVRGNNYILNPNVVNGCVFFRCFKTFYKRSSSRKKNIKIIFVKMWIAVGF